MKKTVRIIVIALIIIAVTFSLSKVIYAATVEKTTILCRDENMFNALKTELASHILLPTDVDPTALAIQIPTDDIPTITELNLYNKQITDITGIEVFTALEKLNLGKNNISSISQLQNLNNLEELQLNDNIHVGSNLYSVLSNKTTLIKLNISNTGTSVIGFIEHLTELQELEMANGSFGDLTSIERLNKLKKLDVSGNQSIRTIESILKLQNTLEILNISNTGIKKLEIKTAEELGEGYEVGIGIYNLTKLKELYIRSLDIDTLEPVVINKYVEEHHKDEDDNWVGENVAYLNNLEVLDIGYINRNENSNVNIPSFSDIKCFWNLKKLYMEKNQLTDVSGIYELPAIEEINLKDNKINDLSGIVNLVEETDEHDNTYTVVKDWLKATTIDLSGNEIDDISLFPYLYGKNDISFLDLSSNHIYDIGGIEWIDGTLKLQDQRIHMSIYKKPIDLNLNQYIILLPIMQMAKSSGSKVYAANANYVTTGCTLNNDSNYTKVNYYNVIIDKSKTQDSDEISVELTGGIADGSKIIYNITDDAYYGIDSILFNDQNLCDVVFGKLYETDKDRYLIKRGKIINTYHDIITNTTEIDASNKNVADVVGLENFDGILDLNISANKNIQSIEPLKFCTTLEVLNASETSIGDNISPIEKMEQIKELLINNVGLTKIDSINNLTNIKKQKQEETTLIELGLSANSLDSINGVEEILSLRKLSATDNNLTEIPDLTPLENLERLTLFSNKISKFPKVGTASNKNNTLKFIFMSGNKLTDISELANVTDITELNLSNNLLDDEDIQKIKNVLVNGKLFIAGNKIKDISQLRSSISKVSELDVAKNCIEDVSTIADRFKTNGTLTANNQRISVVLEQTDQNEVLYDLPQIFIAAKTPNYNFFATNQDFEVENCSIVENKVKINVAELGNKVATVKIKGGAGINTILSISAPINVEVNYNVKDWTKDDVKATISFTNRNNVTITNNDGSREYTFTENGEFTFEFEDEYGMQGSKKVEVTWIDKEAPKITGVENGKTYTHDVTPIITDNHELGSIVLTKDGTPIDGYTSGTPINEYGQYVLTAKDSVNNETVVSFTIGEEPTPTPTQSPTPTPSPKPSPTSVPTPTPTLNPTPTPSPTSKPTPTPTPTSTDKFESDKYTIDETNELITDIDLDQTLETFKQNINSTLNYRVTDKNGVELSNTSKVGTGCKVIVGNKEYRIVVRGDLTGTGNIGINDLAQAQKVAVELIKEDLKILATDFNKNGKIDISDLAKIQKIFVGK